MFALESLTPAAIQHDEQWLVILPKLISELDASADPVLVLQQLKERLQAMGHTETLNKILEAETLVKIMHGASPDRERNFNLLKGHLKEMGLGSDSYNRLALILVNAAYSENTIVTAPSGDKGKGGFIGRLSKVFKKD